MENVVNWISTNWVTIAAIYGAVVACASVIIKITPTQADDVILAKVLAVVDFFSTVNVKKPIDPNAPTEATKK
jgi:hypothetical protein